MVTQIFYTIGFVFLLVASIGVLAIQLCFIIEKEILAMRVLSLLMFASGTCCAQRYALYRPHFLYSFHSH